MKFRIREVDATDDFISEELTTLHDLTFFDAGLRPDLDKGHWWLVSNSETHQNIAFAGITQSTYGPNVGYLKRAGVLPEARGHGLQSKLITVRERKARKNGWTLIVTDTTENPASSNSLIRAGYKIFEPAHRWAFTHSIYWKKELT